MDIDIPDIKVLQRHEICLIQSLSIQCQGKVLVPSQLAGHFRSIEKRGGEIIPDIFLEKVVLENALSLVGAQYSTRARPIDAPKVFSCSTFTQHVFASVGIHLPRYAINQAYFGGYADKEKPPRGTLLFWKGKHAIKDRGLEVGHVGLVSGSGRIIHGSCQQEKIAEEEVMPGPVCARWPFPSLPMALVIVPKNDQGLRTALDLARWLER